MSRNSDLGRCRVHGGASDQKLTFEHVPPEKAFNSGKVRIGRLETNRPDPLNPSGAPRGPQQQRGFGFTSLCGNCNNNLGSWYAGEYVQLARIVHSLFSRAGTHHGALALTFPIRPLRIIKHVYSMFMAISHPNISDGLPGLREFLLDKKCTGVNPRYRVSAFLNRTLNRSRASGPVVILHGSESVTVFEVAHYPLGFLMEIDGPRLDATLLDITDFSKFSYDHQTEVTLPLSVKDIHAYVPGDYRHEDQIEHDAAINREFAKRRQ